MVARLPSDRLLVDARGRPLRELRVSVTDRCNFRCRYCMPREHFDRNFRFLPRADLLSFEEIAKVAALLADLGVRKLRITGGEPLLRKKLPRLIEQLRRIENVELALTTNGILLAEHAQALAAAGLHRVTVSLDTLDDQVLQRLSDTDASVREVLEGIDAAARAGLGPIKINTVVQRGVNDHEVVRLAKHFKESGHTLRFIEYMDVGTTNGWTSAEVVSRAEILERVAAELPLEPLPRAPSEGVARLYRYLDGRGELGVIASVTAPFCGSCTRARLSAEGRLHTCLFSTEGTDLRHLLRDGGSTAALRAAVERVWRRRDDRYSEVRSDDGKRHLPRVEMSYIGG